MEIKDQFEKMLSEVKAENTQKTEKEAIRKTRKDIIEFPDKYDDKFNVSLIEDAWNAGRNRGNCTGYIIGALSGLLGLFLSL